MGLLIDGVWHDQWYDTKSSGGRFVRRESAFRGWVTRDGSSGFAAEPGRYHLYVSLACPWAHRTLIYRKLKGLEDAITVSVVDWHMGANGWEFSEREGCVPDTVNGCRYLYELYLKAKRDYSGRATVPVLWDKRTGTIVSNESAEIIRMLNSAFDGCGADPSIDLYPTAYREEIDRVNARVYDTVNNGVYKAGFATTQSAYEHAFDALFESLDWLEETLGRQRFIAGDRVTEADWRLFTTLLRFDPVYFGHFKCNRDRVADFARLSNYLRALYQVPGVKETVSLHHIKHHYYESHPTVNPTGIVPKGPRIDLDAPHTFGEVSLRG